MKKSMLQAVLTEPGKIEFRRVAAPVPGKGQVLIRVMKIGVCGSDVHAFHGKHPFVSYPLVQGHEFAGAIEQVGEEVTGLQPGDLVSATPQEVCRRCNPCLRGQYNACEQLKVRGFQAPGCAQELFVTETDKIVKLPDGFDTDQGAFLEPLAVAVHVARRSGAGADTGIVISGAGPIGNLIAQTCRARGAEKLLLTDISDYRIEVARRVGISNVCNVTREPLAAAAGRVFGQAGFSLGIEAAGVEASLSSLIDAIGKGGTVLSVGVFEEKPRVDMSVVCEHELSVLGSMMYRQEDWQEAAGMLAGGQVKTGPLLTKRFSFAAYAEAYEFIAGQGDQSMKVMIELQ